MSRFKPRSGIKKFILAVLGILFLAVAFFVVYRIADAALGRTLLQNRASSLPAGSAVSSALSSVASAGSEPPASSSSAPAEATEKPSVAGVFAAYGKQAEERLNSMTLKEKVGQVFLFRCPDSGAVQLVREYEPGGYCLMASHFEGKTTAQVQSMLRSFQAAAKIPMILTCDEEGGTVVRISKNPTLAKTPFRSPQAVFRSSGMDGIVRDTVQKADLMKKLGLNLNLAPVCDVSTRPADFIYPRAFGKNAERTAEFVAASVKAYNSRNLSCTLKHFPGYGNNADTHTGIAYDKRSLRTFEQSDFLPFAAGIKAGAPCVMVSHNIVESMDVTRPASLSPKVHEMLRGRLGFTGIVMTDDLIMGAIRDYTGGKNPCPAAFAAGNDLLLSSNPQEDFQALYAAVRSGGISESRLDESVLRILAWKYQTGVLQ